MAAAGGGWMTDYDTLPLVMPACATLPNQGRFTVYESGYIPSLMSGSAEEWTRVGTRLLSEGVARLGSGAGLFSDMMALQALADNGTFIHEKRVLGLDSTFGHRLLNPNVCKYGKMWAAHFSHYAVNVYLKISLAHRASFALATLEEWAKRCGFRPPLGLRLREAAGHRSGWQSNWIVPIG